MGSILRGFNPTVTRPDIKNGWISVPILTITEGMKVLHVEILR